MIRTDAEDSAAAGPADRFGLHERCAETYRERDVPLVVTGHRDGTAAMTGPAGTEVTVVADVPEPINLMPGKEPCEHEVIVSVAEATDFEPRDCFACDGTIPPIEKAVTTKPREGGEDRLHFHIRCAEQEWAFSRATHA